MATEPGARSTTRSAALVAQTGVAVVAVVTVVVNVAVGWGWPFALGAGLAVLVVGELAGWALARAARSEPAPAAASQRAYHPLTRRELEVAQLAAEGRSTKEIAQQLHIEASTVDRHLEHIYPKLEVHSRVELANWIRDRGLARNGDPHREKMGSSPDS